MERSDRRKRERFCIKHDQPGVGQRVTRGGGAVANWPEMPLCCADKVVFLQSWLPVVWVAGAKAVPLDNVFVRAQTHTHTDTHTHRYDGLSALAMPPPEPAVFTFHVLADAVLFFASVYASLFSAPGLSISLLVLCTNSNPPPPTTPSPLLPSHPLCYQPRPPSHSLPKVQLLHHYVCTVQSKKPMSRNL